MLKEKYQEKDVSKVSQFTLCSLVHIFLDSVTNFAILDLQKWTCTVCLQVELGH